MFSDLNARISNKAAVVLIAFAGLEELISLIPFAGFIAGPIYWIGVSIYLWKIGMGFVNPRRLITSSISMLAEMLPVIQEFPAALLGIGIIIAITRFEDKTGISVASVAQGKPAAALNHAGTRQPTDTRAPLNADGVRAPNGGLVR